MSFTYKISIIYLILITSELRNCGNILKKTDWCLIQHLIVIIEWKTFKLTRYGNRFSQFNFRHIYLKLSVRRYFFPHLLQLRGRKKCMTLSHYNLNSCFRHHLMNFRIPPYSVRLRICLPRDWCYLLWIQ